VEDALRRARNATLLAFFAAGMALTTWTSRIPTIKDQLELSPGALASVLVAFSIGSMAGLPVSGVAIRRFGTRGAVAGGAAVMCVGQIAAGVGVDGAHSPWLIRAGLVFAGIGMGIWEVAANHEGAAVEQRLGRSVMPWFHGAASAATVLAAVIGSLMTYLGVPVLAHLLVGTGTLAGASGIAVRSFLPTEDHPSGTGATSGLIGAWSEPRTLLIGFVILVAAFAEGTANHWMAVAFRDGHGLPEWAAVLAFAAFLSSMTSGRLLGPWFLDRYGRVRVMATLFVLAGVGCVLVVYGSTTAAFVGAVLWGLGASLGFPVGMSAAADDPARAAARLPVVSTLAYTAFLAGPPFLGFLGDRVGVLHALLAVGILALPALAAVRVLRPSVVPA
jgi:MFS family permease